MKQDISTSNVTLKLVIKKNFTDLKNSEIRGIVGYWEEDTAKVFVYLPKQLSETEMEDIDCALTEVMAQFGEGFFQVNYIFLDEKYPLPTSLDWAYLRLSPEEFKYEELFSKLRFALNGRFESLCLKGIAVDWLNDTIFLYFYTYAFPQKWLEAAFLGVCAEISYQYANEQIIKHIIQINFEDQLPYHKYWAYKKAPYT